MQMDFHVKMHQKRHPSTKFSDETSTQIQTRILADERIQHEDAICNTKTDSTAISQLLKEDQRSQQTTRGCNVNRRFQQDHTDNRNIKGKQIHEGKQTTERKI